MENLVNRTDSSPLKFNKDILLLECVPVLNMVATQCFGQPPKINTSTL